MSGFASELFQGMTLEVETAISPPISVELSGEGGGAVSALLRPRYTLKQGNAVLLAYQPAGNPAPIRRALVVVAALVLLGLLLVRRR